MNRNGVDQAVLIQISGQYDNSYLIECMRRFPGRFSVVVLVDTDQPGAPERLEEWVRQGVEGIRLSPTVRSPGQDPLAIWRKAAELSIPVSCQRSSGDLLGSPEFKNIVKELPNLKIIIEHLGGGGWSTEPYDQYKRVLELAQYSNIYMKVPGLGELCPRPMPFRQPFPFEHIPPLIEMALEAFGANRLMWGSDFPPVANREGYRNALRFPLEHIRFKSNEDKEWVFGNTAATLWKFPSK